MKLRLDIDGKACLLLALLCLAVPLNWLGAAFLAALVHEGCHVLGVFLAGGRIQSVRIGMTGAVMESTPMEPLLELLCILAGPAGSLALIMLSPLLPRTAVCGMIQGLFNLLPVEPLDGGRALRCICEILLGQGSAETVCLWVRRLVAVLLFILLLWAAFWKKMGISAVFPGVFLLWPVMGRKIPCKET